MLPEARANMKHTKSKMSSKIRWMSESSLRTAAGPSKQPDVSASQRQGHTSHWFYAFVTRFYMFK